MPSWRNIKRSHGERICKLLYVIKKYEMGRHIMSVRNDTIRSGIWGGSFYVYSYNNCMGKLDE